MSGCHYPGNIQIIADNSMKHDLNDLKHENIVLRGTIKKIEERLECVEQWKKTAKILCDQFKKPHKCPLCNGHGKLGYPEVLQDKCHSCEGKGIVWG